MVNGYVDCGFLILFITRVYYFTSDVTVVLITIPFDTFETVTTQVVCPFIVQTGDYGFIRVSTPGKFVMRKPFSKL